MLTKQAHTDFKTAASHGKVQYGDHRNLVETSSSLPLCKHC